MALKLKNVAESLGRSLVLKHAKFVNGEAKEVKTDSGSIIEGAGMWIVGLLGVALFLYGFRDIIGNTILPSITSNIQALFSNIPTS
ncbi:MAG: hypothetical protein CVU99_12995 [Firmicutes bacterium HGW-Firmicutes-4]|jgi:hypothetical protein|uniref:Uncharacterized protein n=1 Tax=Acetobacterium malicum TaxID=52692 RepID=A0ABR6YX11_9FIRM|nr:hypothetical protein [Acetobacterium malicum]MBC3899730.1 hypothetical protein [Acetobacterium malicum]PKM59523.1 MAG: hypothetical protein CVU99_12995 [Firmicutes bacterium HGW-Firmicutes-4]